MNYEEVMSKIEEILNPAKNEDYKISDKYFYYCLGYIDALLSQKLLTIFDYIRVKKFIMRVMDLNSEKEE